MKFYYYVQIININIKVPEKPLIDKDTILNPSYLELTFICESLLSLKHYIMTFYLFAANMPINRCLIISINIRWTLIAMIIHRLTGRFSGYVQEIRCYNAYVLTILGVFCNYQPGEEPVIGHPL